MQTRLRFWPVVFLAVAVLGSAHHVARAQLTGRSAVDARRRVRATLAAAMADGTLSEVEEAAIYRWASRLLPPQELPGLRRTLRRLASRQEGVPESAVRRPAVEVATEPQHTTQPVETRSTDSEGEDLAKTASYQEPAPIEAEPPFEAGPPFDGDPTPAAEDSESLLKVDDSESPFEEEPQEATDLMGHDMHDMVVYEDGYYNAFAGVGTGLRSLAGDGWNNLRLWTTVDAFKGPMDLDDRNGNFGLTFGLNTGLPLLSRHGIGFQVGTSAVLSDFYGTQFTGASIRSQNFTTVGLFHQLAVLERNLKWGFAYDWLNDDYYTTFNMGQWRLKLAYELDACREVGIWACIPDKGDTARLGRRGTGFTVDRFEPVAQGSLYYRRCWQSGTSTTAWLGLAEEPGEVVFGADGRVPITCRLALVGNFHYILPSASAEAGQDEEIWSISLGIELTPRWGGTYCQSRSPCTPLLPVADNGSFAVRRF